MAFWHENGRVYFGTHMFSPRGAELGPQACEGLRQTFAEEFKVSIDHMDHDGALWASSLYNEISTAMRECLDYHHKQRGRSHEI